MATLKEIVGSNLKAVRKAKGMSQAVLAEAADLSVDMLGRIERGTAATSFETIEALAAVLSVQPIAFFGAVDFADMGTDRSRALQQIGADLAQVTDDQVFLIKRLIGAVVADGK